MCTCGPCTMLERPGAHETMQKHSLPMSLGEIGFWGLGVFWGSTFQRDKYGKCRKLHPDILIEIPLVNYIFALSKSLHVCAFQGKRHVQPLCSTCVSLLIVNQYSSEPLYPRCVLTNKMQIRSVRKFRPNVRPTFYQHVWNMSPCFRTNAKSDVPWYLQIIT